MCLLFVAGCSQHGGRLLVVVESDAALRRVVVATMNGEHGAPEATFTPTRSSSGPGIVPFSFAIAPSEPARPVDIVVRGSCDATVCAPIERHVRATVGANETRVLRIYLHASCAGVPCPPGFTCGASACEEIPVYRPGDLPLITNGSEFEVGWPDAGRSPDAPDARDLDASFDAGDTPELDAPTELPDTPGVDVPVDTGVDAPTDSGIDAPTDTGVDAPTDTGVDAPLPTCADLYSDLPGVQYLCPESPCMFLGGSCCEFYTTSTCLAACAAVTGVTSTDGQWSRSGGALSCARGTERNSGDTNVICRCPRVP